MPLGAIVTISIENPAALAHPLIHRVPTLALVTRMRFELRSGLQPKPR